MEFVAAKCPSCGGELRLPDDKKQVKCMYCGFDVLVQEAINQAGVNVENLLKLASTAEKSGNFKEAYDYFTKVLEFELGNSTALLGKGISAGYLSSSGNFRASEMLEGVKSAVEKTPDDEKESFKIQIAEKLRNVCSNYKNFFQGDSSDDQAVFQRISIIECLELAHEYNPKNEDVLMSLYFDNRQYALSLKMLSLLYQTDTWENEVSQRNQKSKDWLFKLQTVNPKKAQSLIDTEKQIEKDSEERMRRIKSANGNGCLITVMNFSILILMILTVFYFL